MNKNTLGYKLVQGWIDTVSEHDVGPILEWYDKDAILLGTLAPEPLVGIEEIESYFEMFVEYEPEAEITYIYPQRLGINVIVCDGNYTFELNDDEGGREMVVRKLKLFNLTTTKESSSIDINSSSMIFEFPSQ